MRGKTREELPSSAALPCYTSLRQGVDLTLTSAHGVNEEEALKTVTMLCCLPQLLHNLLPVRCPVRYVTHSPGEVDYTTSTDTSYI